MNHMTMCDTMFNTLRYSFKLYNSEVSLFSLNKQYVKLSFVTHCIENIVFFLLNVVPIIIIIIFEISLLVLTIKLPFDLCYVA